MKPRLQGNTIFDESLVCRVCGEFFTTSEANLAIPTKVLDRMRGGKPTRELLDHADISCPKCRSVDICLKK